MSDYPWRGRTAKYVVSEIDEIKRLWKRAEEEFTAARDEVESLWETFVKVADYLGIDPEQARKIPGKPSQVFRAAVLRKQAEALEAEARTWNSDSDGGIVVAELRASAQRLHQQADDLDNV